MWDWRKVEQQQKIEWKEWKETAQSLIKIGIEWTKAATMLHFIYTTAR